MAKKKSAKKKSAKPAGKKKPAGKSPARKSGAAKKGGVKKSAGKKSAGAAKKKPPAKKKSPAKKAGAKKPVKKAVAKKAAPKKAAKAKRPAGKAAAKKKTTAKKPVSAKAKAAPKKSAPAPSKGSGATGAAAAKVQVSRKQYIPDIERPTGMYGGVMLSDNPKPFPRTSPYSKQELKALREALAAEHTRLRRELASLEELAMGGRERGDEAARFPSESSEYSAEMQAAETIMGVRTLEEERLEQVTEALQRIDSKRNYGLCLACGNKIGIERLIAKPHAHLCMDCRRIFERKRSQEGY